MTVISIAAWGRKVLYLLSSCNRPIGDSLQEKKVSNSVALPCAEGVLCGSSPKNQPHRRADSRQHETIPGYSVFLVVCVGVLC